MGLLDIFSSPEGQQVMSLLAASGPTTDPNANGFGARLYSAQAMMQKQRDEEMKRQVLEQELSMKRLTEDRAQAMWDRQKQWYDKMQNQQLNAPNITAGSNGSPALTGNTSSQSATPNYAAELQSAGEAMALGIPGAKERFEYLKFVSSPHKVDAGSYQRNPVTGEQVYVPDPTKGVTMGPNGIELMPGNSNLINFNAQQEGAKTRATQEAQSPYEIVTVPNGENGSLTMPKSHALARYQTQPTSTIPASSAPDVRGQGYAGGSRNAANEQSIAIMQRELQNPRNTPEDIAGINREIAALQKQSGVASTPASTFGVTPSAAQQAKAVKQAEADVSATMPQQSALVNGRYMSDLLTRAINHPGLPTATGLSGTLDPRNYIPGTEAKNFKVLLDQINGGTFMDAYQSLKGGGQITEVEGAKATAARARMNTAQTSEEFLSGLREYKEIIDAANNRTAAFMKQQGIPLPERNQTQATPETKPTAQKFGMLPPAKDFKGKRMQSDSGKTYRSDGNTWIAE